MTKHSIKKSKAVKSSLKGWLQFSILSIALTLLGLGPLEAAASQDAPSAPAANALEAGPRSPAASQAEAKAPVVITEKESEILAIGEISTTQYIVGGILGTYPLGFGIGHAIQGRYSDQGWIFTLGEVVSLLVVASGVGDCIYNYSYGSCSGGSLLIGSYAFLGFRIWEIVDLWAVPPEHNRRYRSIKQRLGGQEPSTFIVPTKDGALLGLSFQF